ncbi:TRAP transporter large permease subunit [Pararhizobium haloflavum]|uniref:TRAP transporter large permease subunit n=1 Tax=Pararhizobium haloflavum TaxID=2037914 RepID=UPI0018E43F27|nr:TRAP transporter large permease subunit [Pararhizobium haloflavum]
MLSGDIASDAEAPVQKGIVDRLSVWSGALAGWLMLAVAGCIGWEIFTRAFLGRATVWVYDVSTYGLVWFTFLSGAYVIRMKRHLAVDLYIQGRRPLTGQILETLGLVAVVLVTGVLFWFSAAAMWGAFSRGELEPTIISTPSWMIQAGMVLGLAISFLQATLELGRSCVDIRQIFAESDEQKSALAHGLVVLAITAGGLGLIFSDWVALGLLVVLLGLLFFGVPVFAALALSGIAGLYSIFGPELAFVQAEQISYKAVFSNTLLAVPLYILAGNILQAGRVGPELYSFASVWFGHIRGGHAVATVLACGIFAAISGSSVATAATIGAMAIPEMIRRGYDERFVLGLVAAGGTLGILIPPSTPMILYSGITDESTGAMFMGGVVPGALLLLIFCAYAIFASGAQRSEKATWSETLAITRQAIWGLLAPVIVLVGIYTGVFTPTEAAAVVVIYALVVSLLRRTVRLNELPRILADGVLVGGMIMAIIYGALILGTVTTLLQVPQQLQALIEQAELSRWVVFAIVAVFYMILGMFLEVVSILLITLPIIYPLMKSMDFNGIWFGIVLVVLMEMALITPPVGLNLFTVQGVTRAPLRRIIAGVTPFLILMFGVFMMLIYIEGLSTWLPSTMGFNF